MNFSSKNLRSIPRVSGSKSQDSHLWSRLLNGKKNQVFWCSLAVYSKYEFRPLTLWDKIQFCNFCHLNIIWNSSFSVYAIENVLIARKLPTSSRLSSEKIVFKCRLTECGFTSSASLLTAISWIETASWDRTLSERSGCWPMELLWLEAWTTLEPDSKALSGFSQLSSPAGKASNLTIGTSAGFLNIFNNQFWQSKNRQFHAPICSCTKTTLIFKIIIFT